MTPNQQSFVYWVNERENIRLKKERGLPKPWSDNPVMQTTYFTNIDREDDRVTRWIRENWTYPTDKEGNDSISYYELAMVVARIINRASTLELVSQPVDNSWFEIAESILREMSYRGVTIWTSAYMVTTSGLKIDKITYYMNLFRNVRDALPNLRGHKTLREAHEKFMAFRSISEFLSAQVLADLKNTAGHPLSAAPDKWAFSAPGPGSLRGLSWFFEERVNRKNYQEKIVEAYESVYLEFSDEIVEKLCFQNFQNCMCEFDKFMRVTNGTGRSNRKYPGV